MGSLLPAAVYGLAIPPGGLPIPAHANLPSTLRITMAAIDPTADPEGDASPARATLKLIRRSSLEEDESGEGDEDIGGMSALLNGDAESSEDDSDDEEVNGGPSDPSKSKKARKEAAAKAILKAVQDGAIDDMELDGPKKGKGKAKADLTEALDDADDDDDDGVETFVICTLDPVQRYQQPLDLTVGEDEQVFFEVSGTHTVYLTGNYLIMPDESEDEDYDEMGDDYNLSPDDDEAEYDEGSDELDDMDDPRVTEVDTDEEEAPKLHQGKPPQGKKRPASDSEDEPAGLDEIIAKSVKPEPATNGEAKLSKSQRKKLKKAQKDAAGTESVASTTMSKPDSDNGSGVSKKVQFAEKLEQGPTPKKEVKAEKVKSKASEKPGIRTVNGVIIDDRKIGNGTKAKKGSKLDLRYIGKLKDGKVFDANKKGKPFTVNVGAGEVIKGWDIGLEGIAPGGERKLTIPANLAYANKPQPGIPANSQLIFDIKCLSVQ